MEKKWLVVAGIVLFGIMAANAQKDTTEGGDTPPDPMPNDDDETPTTGDFDFEQWKSVPDTRKPKDVRFAIFNRNPGNIKKGKFAYPGEITPQGSTYRKFSTWSYGFCAMFIHIRRAAQGKIDGRKRQTIKSLLEMYAPSSDGNKTQEYINYVAKKTGFSATYTYNTNDKGEMIKLVGAISKRENNTTNITNEVLENGFKLASTYKIVK